MSDNATRRLCAQRGRKNYYVPDTPRANQKDHKLPSTTARLFHSGIAVVDATPKTCTEDIIAQRFPDVFSDGSRPINTAGRNAGRSHSRPTNVRHAINNYRYLHARPVISYVRNNYNIRSFRSNTRRAYRPGRFYNRTSSVIDFIVTSASVRNAKCTSRGSKFR